jgi:hypothetical protein
MLDKTCAIVLSRQPLRPTSKRAWIRNAARAVRWVKKNELSLFTSTGISTWEMLLVLAGKEGVRQTVVIAAPDAASFERLREETRAQFGLDGHPVEFLPIVARLPSARSDLMQLRDRYVMERAHVLVPVSLRKGGTMARLLHERAENGAKVQRRFETEYDGRVEQLGYTVAPSAMTRAVRQQPAEYVIHWTRSCIGPWPTERRLDYYTAILESRDYPRDGMSTLCNILTHGRIVASSRHMPGNVATVSFSGLAPREFAPLMRWRARYREMSFEPYGIGIERRYALTRGIRPVRYRAAGQRSGPAGAQGWLAQSAGKRSDWRNEDELRFRGDFDLSAVPGEKLACFCFTAAQARRIRRTFGLKAIAFVK